MSHMHRGLSHLALEMSHLSLGMSHLHLGVQDHPRGSHETPQEAREERWKLHRCIVGCCALCLWLAGRGLSALQHQVHTT